MRPSRLLLFALALLIPAAPASAAVPHTVQPGETLWSIAAANNLTTRTVAAFNGVSEDHQVVLGSTIMVPTTVEGYASLQQAGLVPADPAQAARAGVARAPTPSRRATRSPRIASRAGVSMSSLAAANGLDPNAFLLTGTVLSLAGGAAPAQAAAAPAGAPAPQGAYTVRAGDTLAGLAAQTGVSTEAMAAMNGLDPNGVLLDRHRAQAAGRRARPGAARASRRPPTHRRPGRRPRPDGAAGHGRGRPERRRRARRLPLARRGDRLAGERVQQLRWSRPPTRAASCR